VVDATPGLGFPDSLVKPPAELAQLGAGAARRPLPARVYWMISGALETLPRNLKR
jgi:hypothetical protein